MPCVCDQRALWTHRRDHLCVSHTRCALLRRLPPRVAVSQKKATQQPSGVNACGIQHNRALFAAAPVVRCALLVGRPRITGGYVLRPCRLPCVPRCRTHSTACQCARAGKATGTSTEVLLSGQARCAGLLVEVTRCAPVERHATPDPLSATTVKSSHRCPAQGSTVLTASRVKATPGPKKPGRP